MKLTRRSILTKKIAFIDGLSGSGKSLIGPFISSLNKSEFLIYNQLYEEIVLLLAYKKIDLDAAKAILRLHADMDLYNIYIGRDVNFREFDDSGVKSSLVEKIFNQRIKLKDNNRLLNDLIKKNPLLIIMSHHVLMYSKLIEKIFSDRSVYFFSIRRNPAKIINSFHDYGWEEKINKSKKQFIFTYKNNNKEYPWFFENSNSEYDTWIEKYTDFVLKYMNYQSNLKSKNHFVIKFEEFTKSPNKILYKIKNIAGDETSVTSQLKKIKKIPRDSNIDDCRKDLEKALTLIQSEKLRQKLKFQFKNYFKK